MLLDSSLMVAAGVVAAYSNKEYKSLSVVIFLSFAMLEVYSDIFLGILALTNEALVYIAYATIQIIALIALNRIKASRMIKVLFALNLIMHALTILHYIIVSNFGIVRLNLHEVYNPIVWTLMTSQLAYLLWMEKDVVTFIRNKGHELRIHCSNSTLVRSLRSSGYLNGSSK